MLPSALLVLSRTVWETICNEKFDLVGGDVVKNPLNSGVVCRPTQNTPSPPPPNCNFSWRTLCGGLVYGDYRCIPRGYRLLYSCRRIIRLMCIVSRLLSHKLSTGPHIGQLTVQISTCLLWISVRCISWRPSCKLPVSSWEQAFLLGLNIMIFVPKVFEYLPSATKLQRLCFYTCLSFCSRGGTWAGTPGTMYTPPGRYTPWTRYTPQDQVHPPDRYTCTTPPGRYTPRPADGYCCGRYAFYWNAFLFEDKTILFPYILCVLESQCLQTAALNKKAFQ